MVFIPSMGRRNGTLQTLSCEETDQIGSMRAAGVSLGAIAQALHRSPSSISRKLYRNCLPRGGYSARHADGACIQRRQRNAIPEDDEKLQVFVIQSLAEGWSPE